MVLLGFAQRSWRPQEANRQPRHISLVRETVQNDLIGRCSTSCRTAGEASASRLAIEILAAGADHLKDVAAPAVAAGVLLQRDLCLSTAQALLSGGRKAEWVTLSSGDCSK